MTMGMERLTTPLQAWCRIGLSGGQISLKTDEML